MKKHFPNKGQWAQLPTPLQKLSRLSDQLGLNLWVKRDDLTGLELSGNKVRKLDYLVHAALEKGANTLITCGGIQSNHCRATAALAARLGLRCILLLRGEKPKDKKANFFLDQLFGAETFFLSSEQYYEGMPELLKNMEAQLRSIGSKSYFIPEGGSNGLGAFGYCDVIGEIEKQRSDFGIDQPFDSIVVANGSGGTQAGLILGTIVAGELRDQTKIYGVNVCYDQKETFRRTKQVLWQSIQEFQLPLSFEPTDINIIDGYLGRGYALTTTEELKFLQKTAQEEGLLLDPVYTGKAFGALVNTVKQKPDFFGENVLFIHTGGSWGLFRDYEEWEGVWNEAK